MVLLAQVALMVLQERVELPELVKKVIRVALVATVQVVHLAHMEHRARLELLVLGNPVAMALLEQVEALGRQGRGFLPVVRLAKSYPK